MSANSAVYVIRNTITNRVYVGSSNCIARRLKTHRRELALGNHGNEHLQRSWNIHGERSFVFEIVEYCDAEVRHEREQYWIDLLGATDPEKGYNIMNLARKACPSPRRSQISRDMWKDPKFVANIRLKRQASGQDPEFRAKISASTKATWATPEHRDKMKRRDERLKENEAFRAVRKELAMKQFSDPEQRRKTSEAALAQWQDEEARKRVLEAQAKGRIEKNFGQTMRDIVKAQWKDQEFRAKRIAALKAGQQRRREAIRNEIVSSAVKDEAVGDAG